MKPARVMAMIAAGLSASSAVPVLAQVAQPSAPVAVQAVLMAPGLRVSDLDRAKQFYATALGLVPATVLHHGSLTEMMLCADSAQGKLVLMLMHNDAPGKSSPIVVGDGFQKVVLRVADVAAVAARMKAAGYPVGMPHDSGHGQTVLMIRDLDGYALELVGPTPHA